MNLSVFLKTPHDVLQMCPNNISSVENQKGAINIQKMLSWEP